MGKVLKNSRDPNLLGISGLKSGFGGELYFLLKTSKFLTVKKSIGGD
jgi:hypothetical protein